MNRKTWGYGGAAAVLLVLALGWAFAPSAVEVELARASPGRFELSVDEDGKTRLNERYVVAAPLAGQLARISLREGDAVAAADVVATLTPVLPTLLDDRSLREQQARLESAQANVQRGASRIARAQVALEQSRSEAQRSEQLSQQGFIAPTKLDTDRLAVRAAQQELQAAAAEHHMATHDLEQARAALAAVRAPLASSARRFEVRSPVAGQVLRVLQPSEASVALGTPLLEVGDTALLEIVAELLTTDAPAATPGSRVVVERWGGPQPLEGRVQRVEPAGFTKVSALGVEEQRVRVVIELTSPREAWRALGDGYRVSVRIITLTQDEALTVPVSAVFPLPDNAAAVASAVASAAASAASAGATARHAVFVADAGRARLVPVTVAARNGSQAWITSGLAAGAAVVVYPPSTVRDGVWVVARKP
jgi:HlyD family secretion protein